MKSPVSQLAASLSVVALLSSIATPTLADHKNQTYFSVERTALFVDSGVSADTIDSRPLGVRLKLGTRLSRWFDIEGQVGAGRDSSASQFSEVDARFAGVYLKGHLPIGFRTSIFGLGGASWVGLSEGFGDNEFSDINDNLMGFSFGVGIETQLSKRIDLTADFISYGQQNDLFDGITSLNFGVKLYF